MSTEIVEKILDKIKGVKVAVCGDFCLDAYWILSPKGGELSVETGLQSQGVKKHYYTLGGASNVAANLAALKPAHIRAIGVLGSDIFGREVIGQLKALGVDTSGLIIQEDDFKVMSHLRALMENRDPVSICIGSHEEMALLTQSVYQEDQYGCKVSLQVRWWR